LALFSNCEERSITLDQTHAHGDRNILGRNLHRAFDSSKRSFTFYLVRTNLGKARHHHYTRHPCGERSYPQPGKAMTPGEWGAVASGIVAMIVAISSLLVSWRKTGPEIRQLDSEIAKRANDMALAMLEEVKADNQQLHEEVGRLTQIVQQKDKEITDRDIRIVYLEHQVNDQHDQIVTLQEKVTALEAGAV
jgi:hypothetical protein